MENIYLIHHGIKGQKWGVRHDRLSKGKSKGKHLDDDGKMIRDNKGRYSIPKGSVIYRASTTDSLDFMNRSYTYTNVTNKLSEHSMHTSSGFGSRFKKNFEMQATRDLKIASLEDYSRAVLKANHINPNKIVSDIDVSLEKKYVNQVLSSHKLTEGEGGNYKVFNNTVEYLRKKGFDGVIDPIDGAAQIMEGANPMSAVIFNPRTTMKITEKSDFY